MAVSEAIFVKLFGAGMQRGVSYLFQKISRLRKIDFALKGENDNPHIQQAIVDFETVLGTYRGEFDTKIDKFLRAIERSGLLEAIAESALLDSSPPNIRQQFIAIFENEIDGHPKNAGELYDQLQRSFAITLRELTKDPLLARILRRHHAVVASRLDTIELALSQLTNNRAASHNEETLFKISKGLQNAYKEIRIETIRAGARPVSLDRIYIAPTLRLRSSRGLSLKSLMAEYNSIMQSPQQIGRQHLELGMRSEFHTQVEKVNFKDFERSFGRAVVLGDPGGGKSTLCQKVCFDLTRNYQFAIQTAGKDDSILAQDRKLAFRVILRLFEQARSSQPQLDILTFLARDMVNQCGVTESEAKSALQSLFDNGEAVLAFDGLDEILDTSKRRQFVDLVVSFCNRHPLCGVLVTSRLVGYDDARLPDDFEEFKLDKLEPGDVRQYVKNFLQVFAEKKATDAESEADQFVRQTDSNASDLRRNPLLLGLMAYLFHIKGDVPSNRPEIYRDCSTLMFEQWDANRGITPNVPSDFERAELFSQIADEMFTNATLRAGVSRDWLNRTVLEFFVQLYMDRPRSISASKLITNFLVGRAWIMSEMGDGVFAFTHQTFLEYFFARSLDGRLDTVDSLLKVLLPKIIRSEWDVVTHLALQLKTNGNLRRQDEALNWLTQQIGRYKTKKYDLAIRMFAARSMEYLNGSEKSIQELFSRLPTTVASDESARQMLDLVFKAEESARHRKDFVSKIASDYLIGELFKQSVEEGALWKLLGPRSAERVGRGRSEIGSDPLTSALRMRAKADVVSQAGKSPGFGAIALQWYGTFHAEALRNFGLKALCGSFVVDSSMDGLSWLVLAVSKRYGESFRPSGYGTEGLLSALKEIGSTRVEILLRDFDFQSSGYLEIPPHVWLEVLREHERNEDIARGCAIICWACSYSLRSELSVMPRHRRKNRDDHASKLKEYLEKLEKSSPPDFQEVVSGIRSRFD